jgi:APA family basic amino acid/polyamine antiporter
MMVALPGDTWLRLAGWTLIGILVYVFYGYRHSRLRAAANGSAQTVSPATSR